MPDYIAISEQLRDQRRDYVRLRERAVHISKIVPDSELGAAMTEQCEILDTAIKSIDVALRISGDT
jgi:hypothetical protein